MIPPGTAGMRPMSGYGMPPGTGQRMGTAGRGGPPGTGMRPGTANRGMGAALNTDVQVNERPVTQQGMSGMKTAGQGPGRQVLDKSYFMADLRKKKQELLQANQKMEEEINKFDSNTATYEKLNRKTEDLQKEVKGLQGELADYNMILDKAGTDSNIDAITKEYLRMKERNDSERRRLETVYTERASLEQRARDVEIQIAEHQASMEAKLEQLAPRARDQYHELMMEVQGMQPEAQRLEAELLSLDQEVAAAEAELSNNHIKQRALSLQEQIRQLMERKYELEAEEAKTRLSPEEQVEQMKSKIKRDNMEMDRMQIQLKGMMEQIKKLETQVGSVKPVMEAPKPSSSDPSDSPEDTQQKYEELLAKEQDLNSFLANFNGRMADLKAELSSKQEAVVAVLEKLAKAGSVLSSQALPDSNKFREMQDELEYKKIQVENAQTTQVRLKDELELRRAELEKIDTLEDKIKDELTNLRKKKDTMDKELVEFGKVEQLKVKAEKTKKYLEQQRTVLSGRKDLIKSVADEKKRKIDAKLSQLQENDLHITLERLEQKIRTLEQGIFAMDDFVRGKEAEADFKPLVNEVASMVESLNLEVQKLAAM